MFRMISFVTIVALAVAPAAWAQSDQLIGRVNGTIGEPDLAVGNDILDGDELITGQGQGLMAFLDQARVVLYLAENTGLKVSVTPERTRLELRQGVIRLLYGGSEEKSPMDVITAHGTMTLRGSVAWAICTGEKTVFAVEDTTAQISPAVGESITVIAPPAQQVSLTAEGAGQIAALPEPTIAAWCEQAVRLSALEMSMIIAGQNRRLNSGIDTIALDEQSPAFGEYVITFVRETTQETATEGQKHQDVIDTPVIQVVKVDVEGARANLTSRGAAVSPATGQNVLNRSDVPVSPLNARKAPSQSEEDGLSPLESRERRGGSVPLRTSRKGTLAMNTRYRSINTGASIWNRYRGGLSVLDRSSRVFPAARALSQTSLSPLDR